MARGNPVERNGAAMMFRCPSENQWRHAHQPSIFQLRRGGAKCSDRTFERCAMNRYLMLGVRPARLPQHRDRFHGCDAQVTCRLSSDLNIFGDGLIGAGC